MEPKRKYKKRNVWEGVAEDILIELWSERIAQIRGSRKNKHIYEEIAQEMNKNNFQISAEEVQVKIHNLSARFKKEKAAIGPSEWGKFPKLNSFLGNFKIYNVSSIAKESISIDDLDYIDIKNEASPSSSAAPSPAAPSPEPISPSPSIASPRSPPIIAADGVESSPSPLAKSKNRFQNALLKRMDRMENEMNRNFTEMREHDKKILEIETEKKELLKVYVNKNVQMMEKVMSFLESQNATHSP